MRLVSVSVHNFRNILDSGLIDIQEDVTCLVGKNESGKTALLQAIYRLNPAYPEDKFVLSRDYPRWRLVKDRRAGDPDEVQPITCHFELEQEDVEAIEGLLGAGALTGTEYSRSLNYNGQGTSNIGIKEKVVLDHLFGTAASPRALVGALKHVGTTADMVDAAQALEIPENGFTAEDVAALVAAAGQILPQGSAWMTAVAVCKQRMPKFFYFGQYQSLPGRIDIRQLESGAEEPAASAIQTARALLELAGTSAAALTDEQFEERKAELEAVSNELTREVFEYWTQNKDLSVEIDLDKLTEQTPQGPTAVARFLEVRVKDQRHGFTNNFDQRSSGFQWFFSFLAAFSQFENYEHGVVVLLDEPALTLHGKAQADFLRFIEERLATTAQVIYTTHSPFMVDVAHLERVRIVEDKGPEVGATVTSEVLSVGDDSIFPLQAALGYDIAQSMFVGPDNLLVEGTSDFTYLTLLSDFLRSQGRIGLSERWRVLPAGGATNVPSFVALTGRALDVTVLVDGAGQGLQRIHSLADRGLLEKNRVFLTDAFSGGVAPSDIEDVFAVDDYLKLYNKAFGARLKSSTLAGDDRVLARIARKTGKPFTEHGRPADLLLRERDSLLPGLSDETLSRFEALFEAINATLA